jgi:hypothetical protein
MMMHAWALNYWADTRAPYCQIRANGQEGIAHKRAAGASNRHLVESANNGLG